MKNPKTTTLAVRIWRFFSSLGLATFLLVLLGLLTWLATLEMVDKGLIVTLRKYFHWSSPVIIPEINGKSLFVPLPGGYWVCAVLLVNMICGGLIRARKGWKTIGVLLAHFGIIFMVAAGGVAQLFEVRGVMMLFEGEEADYAISLTDASIEVKEISDGKLVGDISVATHRDLRGLGPTDTRTVDFAGRPFGLEVTGWTRNAVIRPGGEGSRNPVIDGWTIISRAPNKESELDFPAAYARPVYDDGRKGDWFILAVAPPETGLESYAPVMVNAGGKQFAVTMVKETIPVPYAVKLDDAVATYYPNSSRPKEFLSDIERSVEGASPIGVRISMNEPMREEGFIFFQRNMSSGAANQEGPEFSAFEVVSNPADRWPEYSLYVVTLGLLIHFVMKFSKHVGGSRKPKQKKLAV